MSEGVSGSTLAGLAAVLTAFFGGVATVIAALRDAKRRNGPSARDIAKAYDVLRRQEKDEEKQ